jgi:hypothetical protein
VQFRPHQTLPRARLGDGAKHGAIAAADFEKTARVRKELVDKTDNQFVADDEPEIFCFDFRKRLEILRIHSADGVGKIRREHRNAIAMGDDVPARGAPPAGRPDPLTVGDRLRRAARKTATAGYSYAVHAGRGPIPPSLSGFVMVRDFIMG